MMVNKQLLIKMKQAGCVSIAFGIEFGNQTILDAAEKQIQLKDVRPTVEMIREAGLKSKGFFMIGYPTETRETVLETIQLAITCGINYAVFSLVTPFPGTKLFRYCEENGLLVHKDWEHYQFGFSGRRPFRIPAISEDELRSLYDLAVKKFHFAPRQLLYFMTHHTTLMARLAFSRMFSRKAPY